MIAEEELIAELRFVEVAAFRRWIEMGWIVPVHGSEGAAFEEADAARARLICDLVYDLSVDEDAVPVILSLLDQLHDARRMLRTMAEALAEQPEDVRRDIARRLREGLGERSAARSR